MGLERIRRIVCNLAAGNANLRLHTMQSIMSRTAAPKRPASAAGKALVVRGVIRGLLHGRWTGGDRLTEIEAAELFKVSRTPVREALLELAALGIVELRRNCGAIFLPFGEEELRDLYAVRTLLEVEATRLAVTRIAPSTLAALRESFEMLRHEQRHDRDWHLDQQLHAAIAGACGNPRLAGEIARYADLVQTIREAVGRVLADIHSNSLTEHLRILRSLQSGNPDAAGKAMQRHLDQAAESAVAALRATTKTARR